MRESITNRDFVSQTAELHIASMIVLVRPDNLALVKENLSSMQDVEIFADDPAGKIILVIEGVDTKALGNIFSQIETLEGVMSASLVHHETMDAQEAMTPVHIDHDKQETLNKRMNNQLSD